MKRLGLTLVELVVVLAVIAALAGVLTPVYTGVVADANERATTASLYRIGESTARYWSDAKLVPLDGISTTAIESERFEMQWLFFNPVSNDRVQDFDPYTKIGWRGPYLLASTGDPDISLTPFMVDAWNNTIVMQDVDSTATVRDVRIVSAGPDGVVDIPSSTATVDLTINDIGDDIYVALSLH